MQFIVMVLHRQDAGKLCETTTKNLISSACRKTLGYIAILLCGLALVPPPLACARRINFEVYSEELPNTGSHHIGLYTKRSDVDSIVPLYLQ